jgi:cytochrome c-type biogenesis protein
MQELTEPIAFLAGIVSIFSPCVLPLLPAIVASTTERGKLRPLAIVMGLAVTFVLMGVLAGTLGEVFGQFQIYLTAASIGILVFMGLYMLFDIHLPFTQQLNFFNRLSYHTYSIPSEGLVSGILLGMALGIIWIPCVGPVLAAVLTMVAVSESPLTGAWMLFVYSLGLAVPMLAIAYMSSLSMGLVHNASRMIWIKKIGGFVLILIGVYLAFPYLHIY